MYVTMLSGWLFLNFGVGKIDSSLTEHMLFENSRLKTVVNRQQLISKLSALWSV